MTEIRSEMCIPCSPAPPSPSHDTTYYFDDEMSVFLIEDTLFKVHRHFLIQESDVFHLMFTCPPLHDGPEGVSDGRPISLPGVKAREFKRLLDFFYQGAFRRLNDLLGPVTHPGPWTNKDFFEQWGDLLSIATRFDFMRVRECAIATMENRMPPLDPVEQICLAEKYDIPQWLAPAFESLCQRVNPLEVHEAERIGVRYTALLARAREAVRDAQGRSGWDSPRPRSLSPQPPSPVPATPQGVYYLPYRASLVTRIVEEVFFPPPTPSND